MVMIGSVRVLPKHLNLQRDTMADVRALLKAKRQEARISHPLASYSNAGQLRCSACGTVVKHTSAWEGHLGSKIHRTTVAKLKEEERVREEEQRLIEEQERLSLGKRKAEEEEMDIVEEETVTKKQRVTGPSRDFPADFFSDPSRAPPVYELDSEDEGEATDAAAQTLPQRNATPNAIDLEWERFQKEVVNAPDARETYENATVVAEPILASEVPEGFPAPEAEAEPEEPDKLDEDALRQKKEQEERELIMDRLLDEERAQEEADMKVVVMKNKLELLKKKREQAKAGKSS
ncbi:hypothetical protein D9758_004055 [Tetrapyrgos nigripes]|uniref:Coiled-coil domain-containing protein 16 n=1 Tax=Tetrapyrgos nigripes TaxID=182062 RepID=A0A8H5GLW4_9AGAR|nr:hypothetical protein D9758_004055 [Tetrapyrgos nigripes]